MKYCALLFLLVGSISRASDLSFLQEDTFSVVPEGPAQSYYWATCSWTYKFYRDRIDPEANPYTIKRLDRYGQQAMLSAIWVLILDGTKKSKNFGNINKKEFYEIIVKQIERFKSSYSVLDEEYGFQYEMDESQFTKRMLATLEKCSNNLDLQKKYEKNFGVIMEIFKEDKI